MLIIMFTVRASLLPAVLAFCCWAQTPDQNIGSLAGQLFLFPKTGNEAKVHVKKDHIDRIKGGCDIAVQVSAAELTGGVARVRLENVGYPVVPSQNYRNDCPTGAKPKIDLEISGFARDAPVSTVLRTIGEVLFTPERYLSYRGVSSDVEAMDTTPNETSSREQPDVQPVCLLKVEPNYTEQARVKKYSGSVQIAFIVGRDGRIHSPSVVRPLGFGLDENALRVLPLWRFQPAQKNGKWVACQARVQTNFRLL